MTDLTEQWNNGKLPLGWYYVRYSSDEIEPAEYMAWYNNTGWYGNYFEREEDIVQVIDVVPDYNKWVSARKFTVAGINAVNEIAQLKELLKEWVQFEIEENPNDFTVMSERMSELANKTKEVLE